MSAQKKLIRQKFRDSVLKRDRSRCVFCKATDNIDIHHITDRTLMPAGGYVKENGIALCPLHMAMAEKFDQSDGEASVELFNPAQLYRKVGSSYDKAVAASQRLER
tara:strand:- start:2248 stop:2565 length:318 start_codon:yes stop_codon:yes gene_type:complete